MTRRIVFIPIKHGGHVDLGNSSIPGRQRGLFDQGKHVYLGFKPSPGKVRAGWIVFAVLGSAPHKPLRKR